MSPAPGLISTDIDRAAQILREGGLVAFATETVYGLGANALNVEAVARVFAAKNRPHFDPLIVHVADASKIEPLVTRIPPIARTLADAFWPGPLTLVLPKSEIVPDLVTSGLSTVAVRVPSHALAQELLKRADVPVAAPSANPFGRLSPTCAEHVAESLGDAVDLILDGGPTTVGVESTVLDVTGSIPVVLRDGGITREEIEEVVGPVESRRTSNDSAPSAPGMLSSHYAPGTSLVLSEDADFESLAGRRVGVLALSTATLRECVPQVSFESVEVLTGDESLTTAAAGFFAALRRLDAQRLDVIVACPFPDHGLGRALNDRLQRARHS